MQAKTEYLEATQQQLERWSETRRALALRVERAAHDRRREVSQGWERTRRNLEAAVGEFRDRASKVYDAARGGAS